MAHHSIIYSFAKDFQPTFAAIVVLAAATIAYKGVLKRIAYDKDVADTARQSARLSLCTRLKLRTLPIAAFAKHIGETLERDGPSLPTDHIIDQMTAWPEAPPEFEEAWQHLDSIPIAAIEPLDALRDEQRRMAYVCAHAPSESEKERRHKPWYRTIISVARQVAIHADALDKVLADEIAAIRKSNAAPQMSVSE